MSRRKADESSKWRALVPVLGVATQRGIAGNGSSWKVTARENSTVNGLVALHVRCICIPSTTLSCVTPITHCGQNNQRCNCNMPYSKGQWGCHIKRRGGKEKERIGSTAGTTVQRLHPKYEILRPRGRAAARHLTPEELNHSLKTKRPQCRRRSPRGPRGMRSGEAPHTGGFKSRRAGKFKCSVDKLT